MTLVRDDSIGTYLDQCVDAFRSDGPHLTHRGNTRLAAHTFMNAVAAADLMEIPAIKALVSAAWLRMEEQVITKMICLMRFIIYPPVLL